MSHALKGLLIVVLLAASAAAQSQDVPEALQDWQEWVLDGYEYRDCIFYFDRGATDRRDYVCAWPGELVLSVDAESGRFEQTWTVTGEDTWLPLPGDAAYWPDRVTANGAAVAVIERNGTPSIRVQPGRYRVNGRFEWDERPGVLRIPAQSGLIALTVDGDNIARPAITRAGVFLGERREEAQERDAVRVDVYRLVADQVPTRLVTTVKIDVSGSVREELFGPILPEGFVPVSIDSALPARLEPDGRLRVQVRPGRWEVSLTARAPGVANEITLSDTESNLPDSEIWSYRAYDRLRVTAPEGLPPVDPLRVQVPNAWAGLPAFRVNRGDTLTITERSRGIVSAENQLALNRSMWLDFEGGGYAVRDNLSGTMRSGWRLDMHAPFELESATENGDNLLITYGADEGRTGIELRRPSVDVLTLGRTDLRGAMPVTGWDARFNAVSTTLYLPPGNKLFAAPGADSASGSWAGRWQLLDFFLVLIITIAAWKLFGGATGVVALVALTMSYHEAGAPAWLWLNILVAIALFKVAPAGKLMTTVRSYLGVSALLLVFALVPFIGDQLRVAIYPQLEPQYGVWQHGRSGYNLVGGAGMADMPSPAMQVTANMVDEIAEEEGRRSRLASEAPAASALQEVVVTGSRPPSTNFARYASNAIVQVGGGIPAWQWNAYRLSWNGPVDADQDLRLMILPRWAVTTLRFLEVLLLLLFAAMLAAGALGKRWQLPGGVTIGKSAAAGLLAGFLVLAVPPAAQAQTPDPELLQELESRLTEPADCVPRCAEILEADVDIDGDAVTIRLTIHALEDVAVPLPGSLEGWRPAAVLLDGSSNAQVVRGANELLWIRVPEGRHDVLLRGGAGGADSFEIAFNAPPRVIEANADGWFVAGIKDSRLLSGSLQLTRLQSEQSEDGAPRWENNRFPPFVYVNRTIELGLDWRVTTSVNRIAPTQGGLTIELPLLEGETVVTEDIEVSDGKALVSMNPTQTSVTWQSNLPRTSPLELTAASGEPWKESWYVAVGTVWHAEFSGVPESESGSSGASVRYAEFHPRPGETLVINASRPDAAEGTTLAFDSVAMQIAQGARSNTGTLSLNYRSTRGAQHTIRLPESAEVTSVTIDGELEPLRADAGELTVPILPGEHVISISWRSDSDVRVRSRTPEVDIGAPASNINVRLTMPGNRWLLGTRGPALGPAVLYWSELAVLVLLALILGRIDWTPLKTHHWLLLGLGFSTFNWPVLGVVVVWLIGVGARDKWRFDGVWWRYNLQQAGVIAFTVIALASLVVSLPLGLLGTPDMHITGNGSYGNYLSWFADRSESVLPTVAAYSVPMWIYKALLLVWALWLSFALLRWLPWVWQCFARDGFFRSRRHDQIEKSGG